MNQSNIPDIDETAAGHRRRPQATGSMPRGRNHRFPAMSLLPSVFGAVVYLANNIGVLHAWLAPPAGYVPMGVQRGNDIALYLTWLAGMRESWILPNYNAAWTTSPGLIVPGFFPVSLLAGALSQNTVLALQLWSLVAYICTAYALLFCYRTFCRSAAQALWALLLAFACVPIASLPGMVHLLHGHGLFLETTDAQEFMNTSDGFFHGLGTWPMMTFGTGAQALSIALLARYCSTNNRKWLYWLTAVCLFSALDHPFEIFVTVTVTALVLLACAQSLRRKLTDLGMVLAASAIGLSPFVIQALRVPWLHELNTFHNHIGPIQPAPLFAMLGVPAVLVVILLFFGLPTGTGPKTRVLKMWFTATILVFYVPRIPFAYHVLDGFFVVTGLMLTIQIGELLSKHLNLTTRPVRFLAGLMLAWMLFPQFRFHAWAYRNGTNPAPDIFIFSAVAPADEPAVVNWLRKNARPGDLVLATADSAPWLATAPVHSFASHWGYSQGGGLHPWVLLNSFFKGSFSPAVAHSFMDTLGVKFIVVPDGSPAIAYLSDANLRFHVGGTSVYERPNARMKPYGDPALLALGNSSR